MVNHLRRALTVLAFLLFAGTVTAHRYHTAITTITRDSTSGDVEIEHRLFMHDLEPVLRALHNGELNLDNADGEAAIRAYVEQRFALRDAAGNALPLHWVGVELDHTYATIYQELPRAPALTTLHYHNRLLLEINRQINTVNLNDGRHQTTLVFSAEHDTLTWPQR